MILGLRSVWATSIAGILLSGMMASSAHALTELEESSLATQYTGAEDDGSNTLTGDSTGDSEALGAFLGELGSSRESYPDYLGYRLSIGATGALGFGVPADNAVLYARDTELVKGFALAPPMWTAQVGIRVGKNWELVPTVTLQSIFISSGVYAEWGGELRARLFLGSASQRWNGFVQFGGGYGRYVHVVRVDDEIVRNGQTIRVNELDRAEAGKIRVLAGGGARFNISELFALDFFGTAMVLAPDTSVTFDLGLGIALRL